MVNHVTRPSTVDVQPSKAVRQVFLVVDRNSDVIPADLVTVKSTDLHSDFTSRNGHLAGKRSRMLVVIEHLPKSFWRKAHRYLLVAGVATSLAGCANNRPATVDGECRVFTDPGFAVQGKRLKDKQWIGATQEKGIAVCGWQRPRQ
jgi:hypothetical protein